MMQKLWLVLLAICLHASEIHITEVMSNPQGSEYENEFVEVVNTSEHVIQINGWILTDGVGIDTLSWWRGPEALMPGKYAVVLDPGYNFESGPYPDLDSDSIPIYTISTDASLGSGGLANAAESVIIFSPDSTSMTSMSWTTATENGYSWERVGITGEDSNAQWQQSLVLNGTPGFRNSVSAPEINLALAGLQIQLAQMACPVEMTAQILNSGATPADDFQLLVYADENQNYVQDGPEWNKLYTFFQRIEPEALLAAAFTLPALQPGVHRYEARVMLDGDQCPQDDSARIQLAGAYPENSLSINEIMASPDPDQGGEWIEIWNHFGAPVSLQGWTLSDATATRHLISDSLLRIPADSLFVLARELALQTYFDLAASAFLVLDSWPTLNSSSDSVRLFDAAGRRVTSAYYRGSWGLAGHSLERRHPTLKPYSANNWKASLHPDGATPLASNSQQLAPLQLRIEAIRKIFSQHIGPADVTVTLSFSNQGLEPLTSLTVQSDIDLNWTGALESFAMDSLVLTLPQLPAGVSTHPLQIYYNDTLLADTSFSLTLGFPPEQVALNEILNLPGEDQVEFLEFVNISSGQLNLQGWSLEDRSGSVGSIAQQILIPPNHYFILCSDSAIMTDWCQDTVPIIELNPWPSLNNSTDSLTLWDPLGNLQLSHGFATAQGAAPGISLERKALWRPAHEWDNWRGSVDPSGSTPGRINSVILPQDNLALLALTVEDTLPATGTPFLLAVTLVNAGFFPVGTAQLQLRLIQQGRLIQEWEAVAYDLLPGETVILSFEVTSPVCGWLEMQAELPATDDGNPDDDHLNLRSYISCETSPLVISEILPIPEMEGPEWIELYNRGTHDLDLQGWQISDNNSTPRSFSDNSLLIAAADYILLLNSTADPEFQINGSQLLVDLPSLNNSSDALRLWDPLNQLQDAMHYGSDLLPVPGRSLERIRLDGDGSHEANWGISIAAEGATPGYENSLDLKLLSPALTLDLGPNPFSPNGDGLEDVLEISCEFPFEQGIASIWIFDTAGRRIAEPVQSRAVSHRGHFAWDGKASYGAIALTGLYILKLMVDDLQGRVWTEIRKVYLLR